MNYEFYFAHLLIVEFELGKICTITKSISRLYESAITEIFYFVKQVKSVEREIDNQGFCLILVVDTVR